MSTKVGWNDKLTPAQNVAVALHEQICLLNHTDYCGWYYDDDLDPKTWTNQYSAHKNYLEKAEKALAVADADTILNVLEAIG